MEEPSVDRALAVLWRQEPPQAPESPVETPVVEPPSPPEPRKRTKAQKPTPEEREAQRKADLERHIQEVVDSAPPLRPEQQDRIRALLRPPTNYREP